MNRNALQKEEIKMDGIEKRRSKRIQVDLKLNISNLFKQNNEVITHVDAPIHVTDISKGGIGFTTTANLPDGYYFNAKIQLGNEDSTLFTVLHILRCSKTEGSDECHYGAEFIGLAPIFDYIFEDFEFTNEK